MKISVHTHKDNVYSRTGYYHPYICSNGEICWGNAASAARDALAKGEDIPGDGLLQALLMTYTPEATPYAHLAEFHQRQNGTSPPEECGLCGEGLDDCSCIACEHCDHRGENHCSAHFCYVCETPNRENCGCCQSCEHTEGNCKCCCICESSNHDECGCCAECERTESQLEINGHRERCDQYEEPETTTPETNSAPF